MTNKKYKITNSNVRTTNLTNAERSKLLEMDIDPTNMRAAIVVQDFMHPDGSHMVLRGTRGGLIDDHTSIRMQGWIEEGSVAINSTINSAILSDSVIKNSSIDARGSIGRSTVTDSTVRGETTIMQSEVNGSTIDDSKVYWSGIKNSVVVQLNGDAATIDKSKVSKSTVRQSGIVESVVNDSKMWGSTITKSEFSDVKANAAEASNAKMDHSRLVDSKLENCNLQYSTIRHVEEVVSESGANIYIDPTLPLSAADQKFIDRGWSMEDHDWSIGYEKDGVTIFIGDDGVSVSMKNYDLPDKIPFEVIDIVAEKVHEITNKNHLELSSADLEDLKEDGLKL